MSDLAKTGDGDGLQIQNSRQNYESPIQRLHPELLSEIFLYCLKNYYYPMNSLKRTGQRRLPRMSVKEAPLSLCRICRHWRQLALTNPQLWAQIELRGRDPSSHFVALDEWLVRSQRSALYLSVNY
ncbi:hypothetical protein BD410DRAFT_474337 [Rickenella mellea]|uniref:F-box domain-containing protein n=1 Tax=Rickenella mellea TaxID=50990 RepID=A0A4Y7QHR4_9AGAM|nr:hypothetical protein BD410DRAFT_474337 [Rickenella mellea]